LEPKRNLNLLESKEQAVRCGIILFQASVRAIFGEECQKRGMLVRVAGDAIMKSPTLIMTPGESRQGLPSVYHSVTIVSPQGHGGEGGSPEIQEELAKRARMTTTRPGGDGRCS